MGRPPLTEDQVEEKVLAYCRRYGVSPSPEGIPPFPSGKRETRQHREWLTVYRARQRLQARSSATASASPESGASSDSSASCRVCARAVTPEDSVSVRAPGRRHVSWRLHAPCAELVHLARKAGPKATARLTDLLWPRHGPARF